MTRIRPACPLRGRGPVRRIQLAIALRLVAQGANDPRVRKSESDQIVAALRERNVDVEYLVKDDEGHGFSNEENQFDFYRAMERFLGRHLRLAPG
jgi:dipeptidyl aminopeptidase/acylaminoacyl peptidase